jgi:hypothetical protein
MVRPKPSPPDSRDIHLFEALNREGMTIVLVTHDLATGRREPT